MKLMFVSALAIAGLFAAERSAHAVTLGITYFTVAESGDPDFNTNPCCSSYYTNEVGSTLKDGLPVYNASYSGPTLYDVNSSGELTWWSPSQNKNVAQTGTGTVSLPYNNGNFFPPNGTGTNDGSGFQAAILRGVLTVPTAETVSFSFGADDDAFLALGNDVISQEGGIHGVSAAPVVTSILTPGNYDLTLFYTDRHETGAGLYFSVDTQNVGVTPPSAVPLPATLPMLGTAVAGLGGLGWRRKRRKAA